MQKIDKKWKNAFFALKSGRLGVFDAQFWNKFQSKPKIWLHQKLIEVSTWKTINSWKFLLHPKKDAIKFTLGGKKRSPPGPDRVKVAAKLKMYQELSEKYPKAQTPLRLPLDIGLLIFSYYVLYSADGLNTEKQVYENI